MQEENFNFFVTGKKIQTILLQLNFSCCATKKSKKCARDEILHFSVANENISAQGGEILFFVVGRKVQNFLWQR